MFERFGVNICPAQLNSLSHAADAASGVFSLIDKVFRSGYAFRVMISPVSVTVLSVVVMCSCSYGRDNDHNGPIMRFGFVYGVWLKTEATDAFAEMKLLLLFYFYL
jgi:hypothetical protein